MKGDLHTGQRQLSSDQSVSPGKLHSGPGCHGHLVPTPAAAGVSLTLPLPHGSTGFLEPLCKTYFPCHSGCADGQEQPSDGGKRELFSQIRGWHRGTPGEGGPAGAGLRHGANFQFYPAGCKVTLPGPQSSLEKFLTRAWLRTGISSMSGLWWLSERT